MDSKDERERESIRQLAETLGAQASLDLPAIYRDVLLAKPELATVVAPLDTPELRQYAYEMAVGVVAADGRELQVESEFLSRLARPCSCRPDRPGRVSMPPMP